MHLPLLHTLSLHFLAVPIALRSYAIDVISGLAITAIMGLCTAIKRNCRGTSASQNKKLRKQKARLAAHSHLHAFLWKWRQHNHVTLLHQQGRADNPKPPSLPSLTGSGSKMKHVASFRGLNWLRLLIPASGQNGKVTFDALPDQ